MKNHRLISVLCAISMSLTLVLPVGAENVHSQPSNQLNESASAEILFTYAEEIELAEEMAQCTITQINDATLQILAQTAIEHLDNMQYSFRDMMDDIGEAFFLQSVQANNIPMTRANNEVTATVHIQAPIGCKTIIWITCLDIGGGLRDYDGLMTGQYFARRFVTKIPGGFGNTAIQDTTAISTGGHHTII